MSEYQPPYTVQVALATKSMRPNPESGSLFDSTSFHSSLLPWLPDETLFSLCSRHHRLWGYATSGQSTVVLFGNSRRGTQHDLPNAIDAFTSRTQGIFGAAGLMAANRTLLKFYRPFLSASVIDGAIQTMRGPSVAHLKFRLGLLTSRFRANHPLKACKKCMELDLKNHGWVYWHLSHQYPGVWICPEHAEPLQVATVKSTGVERFLWQMPHMEILQQEGDWNGTISERAIHRLAMVVSGIIEHDSRAGWAVGISLQKTIRKCLLEKGWLTSASHMRLKQAAADYVEHCKPLRVLSELSDLPTTTDQASKQLGRLLRPLRSGTHPLRFLVAIDWLFGSAEAFIQYHEEPRLTSDHQPHSDVLTVNLIEDDTKTIAKNHLIDLLSSGVSVTSAADEVGVSVATAMA